MDKNYWKDAYKDLWARTGEKETFIQEVLEQETGYKVKKIGFGAGTTEFLPGSAAEYGQEKGGADLYVEEADAYVEVTGPNIPVSENAPLWVRPDKIRNSVEKIKAGQGRVHAIVHVAEVKPDCHKVIRVIIIGREMAEGVKNRVIQKINPTIRNRKEIYYEIPANHPCVIPFADFISMIRNGIN